MILEALNYAASLVVTPRPFRPALRYAVNLWSRANRCKSDWADHEARCKAAILATSANLSTRRTCVILGSGLLRDVPVRELSNSFDTVLLFDIAHLASVRMSLIFGGLSNVRCIHRDLSGLTDILAGQTPEPLAFLKSIPYLDLVISANLLSQIGTGVQKQLARPEFSNAPTDAVAQTIAAHLAGLEALTPPAVLLTDIDFSIWDKTGKRQETTDLMHGVPAPHAEASWDWPVAPFGEITRNYRIVHRVIVSSFNTRQSKGGSRS